MEITPLACYPHTTTADLGQRKKAVGHLKKVIEAARMMDVPIGGIFEGRGARTKMLKIIF